MKIQPQSVVWATLACAAKKNHVPTKSHLIALLAIWMLTSSMGLYAQSYSEFNLSDFAHAVTTPAATLMEGDTATFTVSLGNDDAPAEHVMAVRIDLNLSASASIPANIMLSVANSWAFDPTNLSTTIVPSDVPLTLSIEVRRADGSSVSGYGSIFQFRLVATADNVSSSDLITALDGLVIVENIDCKMAQYPRHQAPENDVALVPADASLIAQAHAYPNPTLGSVHIPMRLEAGMQAYLIAPNGQVAPLPSEYRTDAMHVDLNNCPAGFYQLQIRQNGIPIWQERILKR